MSFEKLQKDIASDNIKIVFPENEIGDEYAKSIFKAFKRELTKVCKTNGWKICDCHYNHFDFSGMINVPNGKEKKFVYFSAPDIRSSFEVYNKPWYKEILVRSAQHAKDWTGNTNNNCEIKDLENAIIVLANEKGTWFSESEWKSLAAKHQEIKTK